MTITPLFSHVGYIQSAVHREPPPDFLEKIRPLERKVIVRTDGAVHLLDAIVVGPGVDAFAVVTHVEEVTEILVAADGGYGGLRRTPRTAVDVVHVASGLRAWRARDILQGLRDVAQLAWLGAWEIWADNPGARPTPPAATAYLEATGGRAHIEIPF